MKTVFMFSGQGSQYFHMGLDLYTQNPVFRASMARMDELVRDLVGYSVIEALYDKSRTKADLFDKLRLSHPAIFMVELAMAETLVAQGIEPDMVLGSSLGTFAAASVAGFVSWEAALTTVVRQALAIEAHAPRGGMIAVLADVQLIVGSEMESRCDIAAYNFATHFVLSAPQEALEAIESFLRSRDAAFQPLPVSFPFHSRWIDSAREKIQEALRPLVAQPGHIPMACCAQKDVLTQLPPEHFWHVVRQPIQLQQLVATLEKNGPHRYVDVGPSGTLATFLRYAMPEFTQSKAFPILTPYGREMKNLAALTEAVSQQP